MPAVSCEQFGLVETIQTEVLEILEAEGFTDNTCLALYQLGSLANEIRATPTAPSPPEARRAGR